MYSPCTSSASLAVGADRVVSNLPGLLCNITLNPGTATSTVTVYDHPSASSGATVLWSMSGAANDTSTGMAFSVPIVASKGIVVVVTGTAATAFVGFTQSG